MARKRRQKKKSRRSQNEGEPPALPHALDGFTQDGLEALPELLANAQGALAGVTAEMDELLKLAKERGVELPEKLRREIEELRESIRRGPPGPA